MDARLTERLSGLIMSAVSPQRLMGVFSHAADLRMMLQAFKGIQDVQFKEQGGKVQVLVYVGYDKVKCRAIVKMVGSFDKYTYKPSAGLLDKLTVEQRDELQAECDKRRQVALGLNRKHYINALGANLRGAYDALNGDVPMTAEQAADVWAAMGDLVKAMRKAGHVRPAKIKPVAENPRQASLIE